MMASDKTIHTPLLNDEAILNMILDDLKFLRRNAEINQKETRDEFRRMQDKMDALKEVFRKEMSDMSDDTTDQAVDIGKLQTKMKVVAWISGAMGGLIGSALLSAILRVFS